MTACNNKNRMSDEFILRALPQRKLKYNNHFAVILTPLSCSTTLTFRIKIWGISRWIICAPALLWCYPGRRSRQRGMWIGRGGGRDVGLCQQIYTHSHLDKKWHKNIFVGSVCVYIIEASLQSGGGFLLMCVLSFDASSVPPSLICALYKYTWCVCSCVCVCVHVCPEQRNPLVEGKRHSTLPT